MQLNRIANSNILLCSGQIIDDVIQSPPETLKDVVIAKISHAIPDVVDGEEIVRVTPFGRRRKHVKIECSSAYIKNKIINRARQVRPSNMYFSEFLTQRRNKMLHALRSLKVKYPNRIQAVYTRNGNLFYKIGGADGFRRVCYPEEVTELQKRLSRAEESRDILDNNE